MASRSEQARVLACRLACEALAMPSEWRVARATVAHAPLRSRNISGVGAPFWHAASGAMGTAVARCGHYTGTLVAGVRSRRPAIDPQLDRIGALVDALDAGLKRGLPPESIGEILDENHSLLAAIGVSTPTLDAIVHTCRRAGAHGAKLAGAGGGGVVIALVDDPAPVLAAVSAGGWSAFSVGVAPSNR